MRKIITLFVFVTISYSIVYSQNNTKPESLKWLSFQEMVVLHKVQPKKILIDVYTDWCGYCKKMDAETYTNHEIIKYLNDNYYVVKLNAEMKDTVFYDKFIFVNQTPNQNRSTHQLAYSLLDGKLGYPSTVFLDESMQRLTVAPGFYNATNFEVIINWIASNAYKTQNNDEFSKIFVSKIK